VLDPLTEKLIADAFTSWKNAAEAVVKAQHAEASDDEIARLQSEADLLLERAMKALHDRTVSGPAPETNR